MKQQRVIHILEDGRRKYVTHRGSVVKWQQYEIDVLSRNLQRFGCAAYTYDLTAYDVTVEGLKMRFPFAKIVRVVGFETEDHDLPFRKGIII